MSEAVEYRLARNKQLITGVYGLLCFVAASVIVHIGPLTVGNAIVLTILLASGYALFAMTRALGKDGYCRSFYEGLLGDFSDPPLGEWEDELEDRGAFATIESDSEKVIADD